MIRLLVKHRAAERIHHPIPSAIVVLEQLIFFVSSPIGHHDLGVKDVLVALKLGIATDEQEMLTGVREDEQHVSLSDDLRDLARRKRLDFGDLLGSGRPYCLETGFAQEILLLLQVRSAGREKKERKTEEPEASEKSVHKERISL